MEEQSISFETAKLAKEKGFKIPTPVMYKGNEKSYGHNNEWGIDEQRLDGKFPYRNQQWYSIPTQSLFAKWLREKHEIYVTSQIGNLDFINTYHYDIRYIDKNKFICKVKGNFKTYEEALEAGLQEALKLI